MTTATQLAVLVLCCVTAAAQGFRLHGALFAEECPLDAGTRLDSSLGKLQNIAEFRAVPENCGAAMQALQESRSLVRACFNSDDPDILKVLGRHDLSAYIGKVQPLCFGK